MPLKADISLASKQALRSRIRYSSIAKVNVNNQQYYGKTIEIK